MCGEAAIAARVFWDFTLRRDPCGGGSSRTACGEAAIARGFSGTSPCGGTHVVVVRPNTHASHTRSPCTMCHGWPCALHSLLSLHPCPPSMPQQSSSSHANIRNRCPHHDGSMAVTMLQTSPQSVRHVPSMPNRLSPYPSPCHSISRVDHVRPLQYTPQRRTNFCSLVVPGHLGRKGEGLVVHACRPRNRDRRQARAAVEGALRTHSGRRARAQRCIARAREGMRRTRGWGVSCGRARRSAGAPLRCW
jgi:hypothetical protein